MAQFLPAAIMAASAIKGGMDANAQAQRNAAIAEANGRIAKAGALADEEAIRRRNALAMGNVRASAAESGFDPNAGGLVDLQSRTAGELELDALTTRYKGDLARIGLQAEASNYRASGRAAESQGYVNAAAFMANAAGQDYLRSTQIKPAGT